MTHFDDLLQKNKERDIRRMKGLTPEVRRAAGIKSAAQNDRNAKGQFSRRKKDAPTN